jgi:hypothetical protein
MKKLIAFLMVLAVFSTTVFAEAVTVLPQKSIPLDLFEDVDASILTTEEAQQVEGDGPVMAFFLGAGGLVGGAVVGGLIGAVVSIPSGPTATIQGMKTGATVGAVIGLVGGVAVGVFVGP